MFTEGRGGGGGQRMSLQPWHHNPRYRSPRTRDFKRGEGQREGGKGVNHTGVFKGRIREEADFNELKRHFNES